MAKYSVVVPTYFELEGDDAAARIESTVQGVKSTLGIDISIQPVNPEAAEPYAAPDKTEDIQAP